MNRFGLLIALSLAAVVGVVFALWPSLDLWISSWFANTGDVSFGLRLSPQLGGLRQFGTWVVVVMAAIPVGALLFKVVFPQRPLLLGALYAVPVA